MKILKKNLGTKPILSRQHFLLLQFPQTYKTLIANQIFNDYTMGFPDDVGFRSGMALPCTWFNLEENVETPLIIHPFLVMDVTLQRYLGLDTAAALEKCKMLIDTVKKYGGNFTTLWHNSSFSELPPWQHWKAVYEKMVVYSEEEQNLND